VNVKPGDIARIVIDCRPENIGRLVSVRAPGLLLGQWECEALQSLTVHLEAGGGEIVVGVPAGTAVNAFDAALRPLYDGDADDETLAIAGRPPRKVAENAVL
jgi:hypothetical protein